MPNRLEHLGERIWVFNRNSEIHTWVISLILKRPQFSLKIIREEYPTDINDKHWIFILFWTHKQAPNNKWIVCPQIDTSAEATVVPRIPLRNAITAPLLEWIIFQKVHEPNCPAVISFEPAMQQRFGWHKSYHNKHNPTLGSIYIKKCASVSHTMLHFLGPSSLVSYITSQRYRFPSDKDAGTARKAPNKISYRNVHNGKKYILEGIRETIV